MSDFIEWGALGKIVTLGLVVGAGLPALFAIAVRSLAGPGAKDAAGVRPRLRLALAMCCFGIVVATILTAIVIIARDGH